MGRVMMLGKPNPDFLHLLQEDEFLPPMSRWMTLGSLVLVGIFVGTVGLAATVEYNVTVQAPANVRPTGELSIVQAGTEGTIARIPVWENQVVQQGEVIAEFAVPDQSRLRSLQTRRNQLQGYIQQYQDQLAQIDNQLQGLEAEIVTRSGLVGPSAASAQMEQPMPADGQIDTALAMLIESNPAEAKRLMGQRDRVQQQRTGLMNQIQYDQESLQGVQVELNKRVIQAPTDGTILELGLRNPGQTVRPGDVIAQIVPRKVPLVIKAQVAAQDISQVEVGQAAQLRISAYPYPDYGTLSGIVQAVAPDVVTEADNAMGMGAPYYEVTIQPDRPYLSKGDRQYPIQPGMEARADIISRKDTVLRSLLRNLRLSTDL